MMKSRSSVLHLCQIIWIVKRVLPITRSHLGWCMQSSRWWYFAHILCAVLTPRCIPPSLNYIYIHTKLNVKGKNLSCIACDEKIKVLSWHLRVVSHGPGAPDAVFCICECCAVCRVCGSEESLSCLGSTLKAMIFSFSSSSDGIRMNRRSTYLALMYDSKSCLKNRQTDREKFYMCSLTDS